MRKQDLASLVKVALDEEFVALLNLKESKKITWSLRTISKNNAQYKALKDLIYSLALLSLDDIPFELFARAGKEFALSIRELEVQEKEVEQQEIENFNTLGSLLHILVGLSLLRIDEQKSTFQVDHVVQRVIRKNLPLKEQNVYFNQLVDALYILFSTPEDPKSLLSSLLLPHVKEFYRYSKKKKFLPTEGLGALLHEAAYYCHSIQAYVDAEFLGKKALHIKENVLGKHNPSTILSLDNLGFFYESQGKYKEAEVYSRKLIKIKKQVLGKNHPDIAKILVNLASLYENSGNYKKAESLYKELLNLYKKEFGDNLLIAKALNNLAKVYSSQGKYKKAELFFKKALKISEKELGENY
jgi:tetratricopeptide (TPR) repeat protein